MAGTTASNSESRDWTSVHRHDAFGGLDKDRIGMFCRGDTRGRRTKSLLEKGETVARKAIAVLTTSSAESTEKKHVV